MAPPPEGSISTTLQLVRPAEGGDGDGAAPAPVPCEFTLDAPKRLLTYSSREGNVPASRVVLAGRRGSRRGRA